MRAGNFVKFFRGFTLIELLVTLVVAVVLATVAVPGFRGLVESNRISASEMELFSSVNQARSEAVRLRAKVRVQLGSSGGWPISVEKEVETSDGLEWEAVSVRYAPHSSVTLTGDSVFFNYFGRAQSAANVCLSLDGEGLYSYTVTVSGQIVKAEGCDV